MSELLQLVGGGVGAAIVEVAGLQAGHRSGRFFCSARRNVRTSRVLKRVDLCCADCRAQGSESHQIDEARQLPSDAIFEKASHARRPDQPRANPSPEPFPGRGAFPTF